MNRLTRKALGLVVLIVTPSIIFAQGMVVFQNDSRGLVLQWASTSDSKLAPVPVGGGYVQLIAAPNGTPLLHPLGVYEGSSGFLPGYSSLEGFLAANPGWAVPGGGGPAPIVFLPGRFNGGTAAITIYPWDPADYVVIGWTGPYATYDAACAADLANPNSAFLGMSAIATTETGGLDPSGGPPISPVSLDVTFQGITLARAVIPEPITVPPGGQAGDYTCTTNNGTITITSYTGSGGAVTIPANINGLAVTGIGAWAFLQCTSLTNVIILDSVTNIGGGAFFACTNLASVAIPNSVTSIGDNAFGRCASLSSVTIPASVKSIGNGAFGSCTGLSSVTIPNTVTSILYSAFNRCAGLTNIAIPNSVTSIGDDAFGGCANLANVTIPDSVLHIGNRAFAGCSNLINATIGHSVTTIGASAFANCQSLTNVTIGASLTTTGDFAFSDCFSLVGVYFSGNSPTLGWDVFYYTYRSATIYYLPGTTGWGSYFGYCPTALWALPYPVILTTASNFGIQTNRFGFVISWATNVPVVVEACTSLADPTWSPVATNILPGGWRYFSDPQWTNHPARFYRIRSP